MGLEKLLAPAGVWGVILLAIGGFYWWYFSDAVSNAPFRKRAIGWLLQDTASRRYRALLLRGLDWLDARLSKYESDLPKNHRAVAWSLGLLHFNFWLAIAYPMLSLILVWVITGSGSIGEADLIPADENDGLRYLVAAALFAIFGLMLFRERLLRGTKHKAVKLAAWILVCAGVTVVAGEITLGFAVAAAFAFALAFAFEDMFTGTSAIAVAVAPAFALAVIVAVIVEATAIGKVAVISTAAAVLAGAYTIFWRINRFRQPVLVLLVFASVGLVVIMAAIRTVPAIFFMREGTDSGLYVLFVSILPMLNGLADFASCGLTRFLLRRGVAGNLMLAGIRDALAGAALFMALGFCLIAVIHYIRPQDGQALADLEQVFADLTNPEKRDQYWWLAAMLFSTLLPTIAHVFLAVVSFFTLAPEKWRHWIAEAMNQGGTGDALASKNARLALVALSTVSTILPMLVIWYAFTLRHGVLDAVIVVMRYFAVLIGAIPEVLIAA